MPASPSRKRPRPPVLNQPFDRDDDALIPVTLCLPQRRPRGTRSMGIPRVRTVVTLANGTALCPRPSTSRRTHQTAPSTPSRPPLTADTTITPSIAQEGTSNDMPADRFVAGDIPLTEIVGTVTQKKNYRQWEVWTKKIIPALLPRYMQYLRELQSPSSSTTSVAGAPPPCVCGGSQRMLSVACLRFDGALPFGFSWSIH